LDGHGIRVRKPAAIPSQIHHVLFWPCIFPSRLAPNWPKLKKLKKYKKFKNFNKIKKIQKFKKQKIKKIKK
jgi:hypothetical protein